MRKLLVVFAFGATMFNGNAQLKIENNNDVGIGMLPVHKLSVNISGNNKFHLASWIDAYIDQTGESGATCFYPEVTWNVHLGKSNQRMGRIWAHDTYSNWFHNTSDENAKENIRRMTGSPLEKIMRISAYNYSFKTDFLPKTIPVNVLADYAKTQIGFLAQELETVFPELVSKPISDSGFYSVNYIGMIPVLVEAIKEQQFQIDSLRQEAETLKNVLIACCSNKNQKSIQQFELTDPTNADAEELKVFQNVPNPFNKNTIITCFIPKNIQKAELCVYDIQGSLLKCFLISERGTTSVQIQAGQLSAGIYTYLLVGDGKASDAKQMILTK